MFQLTANQALPAPPRNKSKYRVVNFARSVYHDPYQWSLVKSALFFLVAVRGAMDFDGFDVLNPSA